MKDYITLTDSSKKWDKDAWKGCIVRVVSSSGVKDFMITGSNSTTLTTRDITRTERIIMIIKVIIFYPYKIIKRLMRKLKSLSWDIRLFVEDKFNELFVKKGEIE